MGSSTPIIAVLSVTLAVVIFILISILLFFACRQKAETVTENGVAKLTVTKSSIDEEVRSPAQTRSMADEEENDSPYDYDSTNDDELSVKYTLGVSTKDQELLTPKLSLSRSMTDVHVCSSPDCVLCGRPSETRTTQIVEVGSAKLPRGRLRPRWWE